MDQLSDFALTYRDLSFTGLFWWASVFDSRIDDSNTALIGKRLKTPEYSLADKRCIGCLLLSLSRSFKIIPSIR